MEKYKPGYATVGMFIALLKSNPACKGNVHIGLTGLPKREIKTPKGLKR